MKYYVVSDLHGHYNLLIQALDEKGFFNEENKKLIVCGDVLDRGVEAADLVDFLLERKDRGELIYITGNHEDLFTQALHSITRGEITEIAYGFSHHFRNGTWNTLLQLADMNVREAVEFPSELVYKIRQTRFYQELLPSSIDYYETERYIFCHGWIPTHMVGYPPDADYQYDANWRNATIDRWEAARWLNGMDLSCAFHINEPGKTIICGHRTASYGHSQFENSCPGQGGNADFSPFYADGIIAIDACTVVSGKVNCIVLTDNEL